MASTSPPASASFNYTSPTALRKLTAIAPSSAHHHHHRPPSFLLLLLPLLLLLLALVFLLHSPFSHPHLHHLLSSHPLSFPYRLPLSTPNLLHPHLTFLLSPFPIFILANLIIFTLLFKTFYLSSSPAPPSPHSSTACDLPSDFSDFPSGKFDYGTTERLAEYASVSSHEDFFCFAPPHAAHYIISSDPSEEYHVLSVGATGGSAESAHNWRDLQSFDRLNNEAKRASWASKDQAKVRQHKLVMNIPEKLHMPIACKLSSTGGEQGRLNGKAFFSENGGKRYRSLDEVAGNCNNYSQAVVINMEPAAAMAPATRRPGRTSAPALSHPSPAPTPPSARQPAIKVPLSSTSANMLSVQRPPSSPKAKKGSGSAAPAPDGRPNGPTSKPLFLDNEKQPASKPQLRRSLHHPHQSNMVRSSSDQRLSQLNSTSPDAVAGSSSLTNRPHHVQKSQSARSSTSSAIDNLLTTNSCLSNANKPRMQRTQSLRSSASGSSSSKDGINVVAGSNAQAAASRSSHLLHVKRSPSFSEALDALSDADANKCFSNFIAHRFALMKKELAAAH